MKHVQHTFHCSTRFEARSFAEDRSRRLGKAVYFWQSKRDIETPVGVVTTNIPDGSPLAWVVCDLLDEAVKHDDAEVVRPVNPPEIYGVPV